MSRPVLKLQIKPESLERQRRGNGRTTGPTIQVSRETLRSLTRDTPAGQDHLITRSSSSAHSTANPAHSTANPAHTRQQSDTSRDSIVVVQFVENGRYDPSSTEKDENNYDRLLPTADCERLCTFTYGRVSPTAMRTEEGCDSHLATLHIGPRGHQLPHQPLSAVELRDRISQHLPPEKGLRQRSKSTTAISTYRLEDGRDGLPPQATRSQSLTCLYDIDDLGLEWSLGESILKALSRNDIAIFNIEDPQTESEREVNRAWPELKDKMKIWKQSQSSLNLLDATREGDDDVYS